MSTGGILIPLVPLKEKEGFRLGKVLLEMKNITKTFPGVKALDNVNLKVEEGEIHALVGENGAGKSIHMVLMREILFTMARSVNLIKLKTVKKKVS